MPEAAYGFLVVDDHPLFCEALRIALTGSLPSREVRVVGSLEQALDVLDGVFEADAVLLDLNLPDVAGLEGLVRLKARYPRTPIVVISALTDARIIGAALAGGAAGFIPKNSAKEQIVAAMRQVLAGDVYAPPGFSPRSPAEGQGDVDASAVERLRELTPQQMRILELVCEGMLNKHIAYELSIAETTVKAHITAILRKLKVHTRTQAVLVARKARYDEIVRARR